MEHITSWEQWKKWATERQWTMLPYAGKWKFPTGLPGDWRSAWEQSQPYSFVLESGKGGRYTFLGLDPVSVIRGKGNQVEIEQLDTGVRTSIHGKPLAVLRQWMAPYKSPSFSGLPKFSGGAVGFLGYDIARSLERLPQLAEDDLGLDDYIWMRMEELWIVDQELGEVYAIVHCPISPLSEGTRATREMEVVYHEAKLRVQRMAERWDEIVLGANTGVVSNQVARRLRKLELIEEQSDSVLSEIQLGNSSVSMAQDDFESAVKRIQDYIRAGDVFQVNLSLRQNISLQASAEEIYEWLRILNPSPYMGLLRFPDFGLVSASPELLVKLEQDEVSTRPIAGTRRRGTSPEEDVAMAQELRSNEKEQAEHIMLVDLLRNDVGRVAQYGSVRTSELLTIEYYSHVMHLVSQVEGTLQEGKTPYDVIAAVFPGGTITGAPKVRTMEIIEELEPVTRGPYTGAMGWIDYNGNMELNIVIRTLIVKDGVGYIQTGAGIVIDSVPYREYRECHNKARAIVMAVLLSQDSTDEG
ncbi:anthranilate synthase component I family protein [Paenibacillus segetis]|uniref:Anthranilate synthase component I n=1 Tax=Paenibacillus segetis TaxID=1325360 RepID=A0ABQ1YXD7_9BACL|nr:anthranilate synthase component I family protein [Paenibacillus segetis]GGH39569.1 anthranilate synthase component I [Paenibacillus segetis]